jgi:HupF/HypC family
VTQPRDRVTQPRDRVTEPSRASAAQAHGPHVTVAQVHGPRVTAVPPACDEHHCVTCGDDGVPMTVLKIDTQRGLALCATEDDRHETVETALVEPVAPGDALLVHAGTAIARANR